MKRSSLITISLALVALGAAMGATYFLAPRETRANRASPPPASNNLASAAAPQPRTPSPEETQRAAHERRRQLGLEIERALVSHDSQQRETAFNFLLPEMLKSAPESVVDMVARQEPGEARDALRDEVARQWINSDRDAAVEWMNSLQDQAERRASASIAVQTLAATSPAQAIEVADQFGVGRDDGSLERMVQIWATENLDEATSWLANQPDNSYTAQLRARIEQVRTQKNAAHP